MALPLRRDILADRDVPHDTSELYERRSERLRPVLWRLGAALILAASIVGAAGIMTYHPLTAASITSPAPEGDATVTTSDPSGPLPTYSIGYAQKGSFSYSFVITNAGRWGITLTGVAPPSHATFDDVVVTITPTGTTAAADGSFALKPGSSATVTVDVTFAPCKIPPPTDARAAWSNETVSYRVAGVTADQAVGLPYRIAIDDSAARSC